MSCRRFALPHLSRILLLTMLVLCAPLTWAQRILLAKHTPIQLSNNAVTLAAVPEAQTHRFPFHEMPLSFATNLDQTEPGLKSISRGAGYNHLLPTDKTVAELEAKANYLKANAPTRWLANVPDTVPHRTVYVHDLRYYGQRVPLVGPTILRIARQADSHPRVTWVMRLLVNPQF